MTTVALVEDEADIRLLCRIALEGGGHEVREADSGDAALALLATTLPDVVLLDIQLPGVSGWVVLAHIRADPRLRGVKVIVCSAHAGPRDQRRATADGAFAFLPKPFLPAELLKLVAAARTGEPAEPGYC